MILLDKRWGFRDTRKSRLMQSVEQTIPVAPMSSARGATCDRVAIAIRFSTLYATSRLKGGHFKLVSVGKVFNSGLKSNEKYPESHSPCSVLHPLLSIIRVTIQNEFTVVHKPLMPLREQLNGLGMLSLQCRNQDW